jgi:KDO2-lipid IV(A) lauroyltransferase
MFSPTGLESRKGWLCAIANYCRTDQDEDSLQGERVEKDYVREGNRLNLLVFLLLRSLVAVVGWIPVALAYRICETCALLVYLLDRKHRRIGMINLTLAFPERDQKWRRKVLRASFEQLGDHFVEICRLQRSDARQIRERVVYEPGRGLENYEAARAQGKGVIFLTAHVSAWELLPVAHSVRSAPLSFIVRPLDNPRLDRWLSEIRHRFGNEVIVKEGSLRRIIKLLNEGRDVGILMDQNVQEKDGVFVPLFGREACTASGPAVLALKTGARVVPGFLIPADRKGHYYIRFDPAIEIQVSGDRQADVVNNTAVFNRYIEAVIREYPHCWLWGHRRFRTRKEGPDPYL